MASLLPLCGSCLSLCDLMLLYEKTAAVPCCVGPWSTQAPRASQAGSLPCCAPQLAMMPLLNAQATFEPTARALLASPDSVCGALSL